MTNYIGNQPGLSQRLIWRFIATEGQTVFTGTDANNLTLNYENYEIDVYVNGILLKETTDYTKTSSTTLTFTSGLTASDDVVIVGVALFNIADHYTTSESDSRYANVTGDTFTGPVVFPAGNTSVAAISIGSNTNTGFYQPSSGRIGIVTGGTERIRVDASGNVGIGTSSPFGKLAVYGAVGTTSIDNAAQLLEFVNTQTDAVDMKTGIRFRQQNGTNAANAFLGLSSNGGSGRAVLVFAPPNTSGNATERVRIDSSGNVGIGTSSPGGTLHVGGTSGTLLVQPTNAANGRINLRHGSFAATSFLESDGSLNLLFGTNSIERARIDSSGSVLINTTTSQGGHKFGVYAAGSVPMYVDRGTNAGGLISFYSTGNVVGSISTDGTITAYNTFSDYRLKDQVVDLQGSGAFIDALKPREWLWKANGERGVGFIAHEAQAVTPSSVTGEKDGEEMQQMSYSSGEIIANIVAELQSLRKKNEELVSRIQELESKV